MAGRAAHEEDDDGMSGPPSRVSGTFFDGARSKRFSGRLVQGEGMRYEVAAGKRIVVIDSPTGAISVVRPVAEKLLAEGVISGEIEGKLTARDITAVKAAVLGHAGVCDFCSAPGPSDGFDVPDFAMTSGAMSPDGRPVMSTGGWAACETCAALVRANKRKDLLERSLQSMAFSKFTKPALAELHGQFWDGYDAMTGVATTHRAIVDLIEGKLPSELDPDFVARDSPRAHRINVIKSEFSFSDDEIGLLLEGKATTGMAARMMEWKKRGRTMLLSERVKPRPPLIGDVPHWQAALDAKVQAYVNVKKMISAPQPHEFFKDGIDLQDPGQVQHVMKLAEQRRLEREMGFGDDLRALQSAQVYSFNAETTAAIREAAKTIPHETKLSELELPAVGAGWFYFAEPLPIVASNVVSDRVHALLWGWDGVGETTTLRLSDEMFMRLPKPDQERLAALAKHGTAEDVPITDDDVKWLGPALRKAGFTQAELDARTERKRQVNPAIVFSAYVRDEKGHYFDAGDIAPSTRFFWRANDTFHEMLKKNAQAWRAAYGPGSEREHHRYVMGEEPTLQCVGELAIFFAMACTWFKQTVAANGKTKKPPVLEQTEGAIEGKKKRDAQNEMKLAKLPPVHVVALRKSAATERTEPAGEHVPGSREYHCRWIVHGHPRRQPCGPGRKDRKLIWIEAHPAGPADKPLRTRETVYAVIR